jgi:c-di-GMP-binding flagellar brake protein YcgR
MTYNGRQPVDRRASIRRDLQVPIYMNSPNTLSVISGRTQDISLGGMKVIAEMSSLPFQKEDEIRFIVNDDFLILEGEGTVIWISPIDVAVGIKFNQLTEKTRSSLEQFLRLLS